ncbi:MAG: hypothetical protein AAF662_02490 [Pseudomonadota bacterium]
MQLNPFYWLRIAVGEFFLRTTGTWIGSHLDDKPPAGFVYEDCDTADLDVVSWSPEFGCETSSERAREDTESQEEQC